MQKVIKGSNIDNWIGSSNNVSGFVAKKADAGTDAFGTSDEMIEGMRLDYGPSGFQNETSIGVIEWDYDPSDIPVEVPFGNGFVPQGLPDPYPYVGNGFTASTSGRLVPEYRVPSGATITPTPGAKLYEVDQAGNKVLRAVYESGQWSPV
jgi:hypothetical protein